MRLKVVKFERAEFFALPLINGQWAALAERELRVVYAGECTTQTGDISRVLYVALAAMRRHHDPHGQCSAEEFMRQYGVPAVQYNNSWWVLGSDGEPWRGSVHRGISGAMARGWGVGSSEFDVTFARKEAPPLGGVSGVEDLGTTGADALVAFVLKLAESGCSVPGIDGSLPIQFRLRPITGTIQVEVTASTTDDFGIQVEDVSRPSDIFAEKMIEHVRDAVLGRIAELIEMREQLDSALDRMRDNDNRAEARVRKALGKIYGPPAKAELSAAAKAERKPLPLEELFDAKSERVHREPGRARAARTVRNKRRGSS